MSDRPRLFVELPIEIVETTKTADGQVHVLAVCETAKGYPPLRGELRLTAETVADLGDDLQEALVDLVAEAMRADILEAAGKAIATGLLTSGRAPTDPPIEVPRHALEAMAPNPLAEPEPMRISRAGAVTEPRIPHEDRARSLATLIARRGPRMAELGGERWLDRMLASELAAVYADGESKGAAMARLGAPARARTTLPAPVPEEGRDDE